MSLRPRALLLAASIGLLVTFYLITATQSAESPNPRTAVAILLYHHVDDSMESPNVVSTATLDSHISAILAAGFKIISLTDLLDWLDQPHSQGLSVVLTFDDGYSSFCTHVVPLLKKYGVPASCFLIVSSSDNTRSQTAATSSLAHITPQQIRELADIGLVEFGSHSYDGHRYIDTVRGRRPYLVEPLVGESRADFELRVRQDLAWSKTVVEHWTGKVCRFFSYPYGWVTDALRNQVAKCGFELALTTKPGIVLPGSDRYSLPRITVRPEMTGEDIIELILAEVESGKTGTRV